MTPEDHKELWIQHQVSNNNWDPVVARRNADRRYEEGYFNAQPTAELLMATGHLD